MLKQRLLTALVLLPPLLAALFFLDAHWIAALFGIVGVIGAWEWSALAGIRTVNGRRIYAACAVAAGALLYAWINADFGNTLTVAAVSAVFWLIALFELIRRGSSDFGVLGSPAGKLIGGALVLLPAWASIYYLHAVDVRAPMLLVWLFVIVGVADSAAYFAGSLAGRHKLAPAISPGKTVEGVIGGLVAVAVTCTLGGMWIPGFSGEVLVYWVLLGIGTALISVLGDLVESKFKRLVGVKDSGHVLPGHGGVLDRIDAITSAAPAFVLGWALFSASTR